MARAIMPFALILFIAANFPCHIRRVTRHPMMIGTLLWASVHLLANGDLASTILFGGFAAWSILAIVGSNKPAPLFTASVKFDFIAIGIGVVAYALLGYFHAALFGVAVL